MNWYLGRESVKIANGLDCADTHSWINNPDNLFEIPDCEIIKDQKRIKIGRLTLTVGGERRKVYLKRYNSFSWRIRLFSLFSQSGAFRSWRGACILTNFNISTAKPILAVEFRSWGILKKSFYISEELSGAKTIDDYWVSKLFKNNGILGSKFRKKFIIDLARLFRSLHMASIYHNDLKDANILLRESIFKDSFLFYLLDLEGIRKYKRLSLHHRIKNLVQLNRTMGSYVRVPDKLYFLKSYLGDYYNVRSIRRKWIYRIIKRSKRGDRRSMKKKDYLY